LVGGRGFQPRASCAQGSCKKSILLVRLALFGVLLYGFGPNVAVFGPKLDPSFGAVFVSQETGPDCGRGPNLLLTKSKYWARVHGYSNEGTGLLDSAYESFTHCLPPESYSIPGDQGPKDSTAEMVAGAKMSMGHILVVDDEPQIRRVMRTTLVSQGYEVSDARTGDDALNLVRGEKYDLVLLDVNMPGISGLQACREIRLGSDLPIIMLTVRGSERDKVQALDAGADGYLTKPFSMSELLARIRAVLRRTSFPAGMEKKQVKLGDIEIDFEARRIIAKGKQIGLTTKEFDVLFYLAVHANKTITHRELLKEVWGPDYGGEQEYLRVFVNRLRKKIEASPSAPKYLLSERWVEYRLELPE